MPAQHEIDALKRTVLGATEFARAWDAFFRLSEAPRFMRRSQIVTHDSLRKVLDCVCRSLLQGGMQVPGAAAGKHGASAAGQGGLDAPGVAQPSIIEHTMLMEYAGTGLQHGFLVVHGCPGNFLYFRDDDVGMVLLLLPCGQNRMCRFSLARCVGPVPPCLPPVGPGGSRLH